MARTELFACAPCQAYALERQDAGALAALAPGDLSQSYGEWLFPAGQELRFIEEGLRQMDEDRGFRAGLWLTNALVGVVRLTRPAPGADAAGIGYAVDARQRGRGLMTATCRHLIRHGFTSMALRTLTIEVATGNLASRRIPLRLGFVPAAVASYRLRIAAHEAEVLVYELTREQWAAHSEATT